MTLENSNIQLSTGTFYINGSPLAGIKDFEADMEAADEYIRDSVVVIPNLKEMTFECTCKINWLTYCKVCGLYSWVIESCPNRRVKHLITHGKSEKVRKKNFRRAIHIIGRVLDKEN